MPGQATGVHGAETVDIFVRRNAINERCRVQMGRQRQLQQYSVHVRGVGKPVDDSFDILLSGGFGQPSMMVGETTLRREASLAVDVDVACGIGTDENRCKTW